MEAEQYASPTYFIDWNAVYPSVYRVLLEVTVVNVDTNQGFVAGHVPGETGEPRWNVLN
jgi:hypothetical protein